MEFGKIKPDHMVDYSELACQASIIFVEVNIIFMIETDTFVNGRKHVKQGDLLIGFGERIS